MITSAQNPRIQRLRALFGQRKARQEAQAFVAEGVRLCEEALAARWPVQEVYFTSELSPRGQQVLDGFRAGGVGVEEIPPALMESLGGTDTPQGILAVCQAFTLPLPEPLHFVLILDDLRDPGNVGTLLRSALAAGVQAVVLPPGTADAFSPKVLRAGMGAHFRLPILNWDWTKIETKFCQGAAPLKFYLAEMEDSVSCWQVDFRLPLVLIIGGEAEGASPAARAICRANGGQTVVIPMPGHSESLNAGAAGSILIFEVVRQRYV